MCIIEHFLNIKTEHRKRKRGREREEDKERERFPGVKVSGDTQHKQIISIK